MLRSDGVIFLFLPYKHEPVGVVAPAAELREQTVQYILGQLLVAAQNPQIFVRAASDECIAVVGIDVHDVVVGVEKQEEGDFQFAGVVRIGLFGTSLGLFAFAVACAFIEHFDFTVVLQGVGSRHVGHVFFEAVFVAGDFIPSPHESLNVECRHGAVV